MNSNVIQEGTFKNNRFVEKLQKKVFDDGSHYIGNIEEGLIQG